MERGVKHMGLVNIFFDLSDKELLEIYNDMKENAKLGFSSKRIREFAQKYKDIINFETLSQSISFTEKMFYEEVAERFFKSIK